MPNYVKKWFSRLSNIWCKTHKYVNPNGHLGPRYYLTTSPVISHDPMVDLTLATLNFT